MKKLFVVAAMLLVVGVCVAKNVVQVTTSCGEVAYIDTDRTSLENTLEQVQEIDRVLCGDDVDTSEEE